MIDQQNELIEDEPLSDRASPGVWRLFLISLILVALTMFFFWAPYPHSDSWQYYAIIGVVLGFINGVSLVITSLVGLVIFPIIKKLIVLSILILVTLLLVFH